MSFADRAQTTATEATEATMISLGSKSMVGGTGSMVIGYLSSNGAAVLIGIIVTVLGFIFSMFFQYRQGKRNKEKWAIEKEQLLAEERRKEEVHQLTLKQLKGCTTSYENDQEC